MLKKLCLASVAILSNAFDTHLRAGISHNLSYTNLDVVNKFSAAIKLSLPELSAEIQQRIDPKVSFGLSGTYIPLLEKTTPFHVHALKMGFNSYFHYHKHNSVGVSLNISSLPLDDILMIGHISNVSLGAIMQGTLTDNMYAHIEMQFDVTPQNYRSWDLDISGMVEDTPLPLLAVLESRNYATSIALGYVLPLDQ